ncbi:hypothetical protein [Sphingomonas sp. DC1400]
MPRIAVLAPASAIAFAASSAIISAAAALSRMPDYRRQFAPV